MEITLFANGQKLVLSNITKNNGTITCNQNEQMYQAKIIRYDHASKILFFELNNQIYKAKIISHTLEKQELYLFNFNKIISLERHQEPVFIQNQSPDIAQNPTFKPAVSANPSSALKSPLAGRVIKVLVTVGQEVNAFQPLVIIESMKMENEICAPHNAIIKTLSIAAGNLVQQNQVLVTFDEMKGVSDGTSKSEHEQATI